jgi:ribose-phosphate pyrophosphokinase
MVAAPLRTAARTALAATRRSQAHFSRTGAAALLHTCRAVSCTGAGASALATARQYQYGNSSSSSSNKRFAAPLMLAAAAAAAAAGASTQNSASCEELQREDSKAAMWPNKERPKSGGMKIFSGNANPPLAKEIASYLGINLGKLTVSRFADGEVNVMVQENVRGKDVYIIQPTCMPVNENLVELLLMVSTMRRASARRITVVIPYYGYARQDRKMTARVPISAADVARLMEAMGVDRVVAVDLHCGQIQVSCHI